MIESDLLADRLQGLAARLRSKEGGLTFERFEAWETASMPRLWEPGSDDDEEAEQDEIRVREGRTDLEIEDRRGDAQAAAYFAEWKALVKRLAADVARADRLMEIANPPDRRRLKHGEKQAAQIAAEGMCVSCWRGGEKQEIELRPESDPEVPAKPYYKDLCRWCGTFKATHGQLPPASLVAKHHRVGEHVTTADVAKALGRAS